MKFERFLLVILIVNALYYFFFSFSIGKRAIIETFVMHPICQGQHYGKAGKKFVPAV